MAMSEQINAEILRKASNNIPLTNPSQEATALYNKYQAGYNAPAPQQAMPQQAVPQAQQLNSPVQQYSQQAQQASNTKMQSLEAYLQSSAQAQLGSQTAQLGFAKDQALAQLEQSLMNAINQGQLSIKEAQKQYDSASKQINNQAYVDSELTSLTAHDRGIQNSAQMIGLIQGDQARKQSLLSTAMTTRDEQINAINNQLEQMKYDTDVNKSLANSQYNYGLASAQGDIYSKMYDNMFNLQSSEYQRLANNEFALAQGEINQGYDMTKMSAQQRYQLEQMAQQQKYTQSNMGLEQQYTQENMGLQNAFDLNKLSVQQKYQLEQMAQNFGYDVNKLSIQQQYQLAQMAQSFGYDMSLQKSSQGFQMDMAYLGQNFDLEKIEAQAKANGTDYATELQRQLDYYTDGTPENNLRLYQEANAQMQAQKQNILNISSSIGNAHLAKLLESYPTQPGTDASAKEWATWKSQTESINAQVEKIVGSKEFSYDTDVAVGKGKTSKEEGASFKTAIQTFLKTTNIPYMIWNAVKSTP